MNDIQAENYMYRHINALMRNDETPEQRLNAVRHSMIDDNLQRQAAENTAAANASTVNININGGYRIR